MLCSYADTGVSGDICAFVIEGEVSHPRGKGGESWQQFGDSLCLSWRCFKWGGDCWGCEIKSYYDKKKVF